MTLIDPGLKCSYQKFKRDKFKLPDVKINVILSKKFKEFREIIKHPLRN